MLCFAVARDLLCWCLFVLVEWFIRCSASFMCIAMQFLFWVVHCMFLVVDKVFLCGCLVAFGSLLWGC